jgi:hypothetical protein
MDTQPPALAIFIQDEKGPLFREFCNDFKEGRRRAQELADRERFSFFLFSFKEMKEIARFEPNPEPHSYCAERATLERLRDEAEAILDEARSAFSDRNGPCLWMSLGCLPRRHKKHGRISVRRGRRSTLTSENTIA